MSRSTFLFLFFLGCLTQPALAQDPAAATPVDLYVVPQMRTTNDLKQLSGLRETNETGRTKAESDFSVVSASKVSSQVKIQNHRAVTQFQFQCVNSGKQTTAACVAVPLPNSVAINCPPSSGNLIVSGKSALTTWQGITGDQALPGALEFCGYSMLKTQPFTFPPNQSQSVNITYTQTLPVSGPRVDYILPRSASVEYAVPWSIDFQIDADKPISTVYSPTHKLKTKRLSDRSFQVKVDEQSATQPGAVWLSYLKDQGGLSGTLFLEPDESTPEADGAFLFLAGLPAQFAADGQTISREFTLALDRSGSMQGKKIEQVREAAMQVLEGLKEQESFNIITYNDAVTSFAKTPVRNTLDNRNAAKEFIQAVRPRGGTNLHGALLESVRQEPAPKTLPIVLFLTDGLPTVGETDEVKIREVIAKQNPYSRRIYTVGVGVDVNTPLLENIATETRAQPTFVLPSENVKTKVSQVFESLEQPILADAKLEIQTATGVDLIPRASDVFPNPLPDLYKEDQLVVLGRYQGDAPLKFRVTGNYLGSEKTFEFIFPVRNQPSSPFVARLWATQKIADLVQQIRKSGAKSDPYSLLLDPKKDAKLTSKAEDILKLTLRYGILTEYTAFLTKEGNEKLNRQQQLDMAYRNFDERAVKTRVGLSSVNQSLNNNAMQRQNYLNGLNTFWDANMCKVTVPNVQQMGNGVFFRQGTTWVDGRLLNHANLVPNQVIPFGSQAYRNLVNRLIQKGEHTPLSLSGNVLMEIDNTPVLIRAPSSSTSRVPR